METKTWATTTAVVVKEIWMPAASRAGPRTPRLPRVASRAMPATTGGIVMGRTARTRATRTPGHWRASSSARGTPRTTEMTVATTQVRSERPSARRALPEARTVGRSAHPTRVPRPSRGRTMAQPPSAPRMTTRTGNGARPAREGGGRALAVTLLVTSWTSRRPRRSRRSRRPWHRSRRCPGGSSRPSRTGRSRRRPARWRRSSRPW